MARFETIRCDICGVETEKEDAEDRGWKRYAFMALDPSTVARGKGMPPEEGSSGEACADCIKRFVKEP